MADSLSDENLAPVDFQVSLTTDGDDSKSSLYSETCFLCLNYRKKFFCKECVKNGDFVSSCSKFPERFADKKVQYLTLISQRNIPQLKCLKIIERKKKRNLIESEINLRKERIELINKYTQEIKESNQAMGKAVEIIQEKNSNRKTRLPKYKERVGMLRSHVVNYINNHVFTKQQKLEQIRDKLKQLKQKKIKSLIYYVFPITRVANHRPEGHESSNTVSELAEATRTSYIRGKWIYLETNLESMVQIVAPILPENGDYSAYTNWIESYNRGILKYERIESNPLYNMSAALAYTAQLVNLLAFHLDVILPKKVYYPDFAYIEGNSKTFFKKVMKLNMNILLLCMSQKVDTALLNPTHTLNNIVVLLNHELGFSGPFDIDQNLIISLENKFECDFSDDEDSDVENDMLPNDWEAIPLVQCPEVTAGPISPSHLGCAHSQSVASGLVTSLSSIWRGWTGK